MPHGRVSSKIQLTAPTNPTTSEQPGKKCQRQMLADRSSLGQKPRATRAMSTAPACPPHRRRKVAAFQDRTCMALNIQGDQRTSTRLLRIAHGGPRSRTADANRAANGKLSITPADSSRAMYGQLQYFLKKADLTAGDGNLVEGSGTVMVSTLRDQTGLTLRSSTSCEP